MTIKRICLMLMALLTCGTAYAAGEAALDIRTAKPGATVLVDRVIEEGKVIISVLDAGKNPLFGLNAADFSLTQSGRTAKMLSVQPLAESLDVPRHIVLVLDNSYSMKERNAVIDLLAGVDELLKIVRPIDQMQIVVFDDNKAVEMGGRKLRIQTFKSSQPAELKAFVDKVYGDDMLTAKTVLYEAMLAGLDIIGKMPASEPRFMVVFTDGEDINSDFKKEDVLKVAQGLERFNAYAIDYMPGKDKNKFLTSFATQSSGQIWKAESETNLVSIFQSVASKMEYYYVLSYQFPPTGKLVVDQSSLNLDEIVTTPSAAVPGQAAAPPDIHPPAEGAAIVARIDSSSLVLRPVIDSVYGIARWKVSVTNAKGGVASLAGEGSPAPELQVPLPTADLQALAAGGDLQVRMEVEDRKGQNLVLSSLPVKINVAKTTATLAVTPGTLTLDDLRSGTAPPETRIDASALMLRPVVSEAFGTAKWKVGVRNSRGTVAELAGEGAPAAELKLPLPTADLLSLAAGGDLAVRMELQNSNGQNLVLTAPAVKVKVVQTQAKLAVEPASLTIEEIKTIDSSPMLGQIYFAQGSSEIPAQYVRFAASGETAGFDEQKFKDTLEKYYQVLNIVGKRMVDTPAASISLVGCNDNTGAEKGKKTLSGQRAEAVKNYLQTVWGIAPERMTIEARNLPKVASSTKSKEGQAENRRVEIIASDPAILAPIRSTYITTRIDASTLTLRPEVTAPYGIADWKISASNAAGSVADLAGKDAPARETKIALDGKDLRALATAGDITVKMELQDRKGQKIVLSPAPVKVNFVETRKRIAEKLDQKVQEKYALILFDFDKDTISGANQELVNRIVDRYKTLPQATMSIVGHTDNIGKETYNVKLSERRAAAVNKMVASAYGENAGDRIRFSGVGPASPLFDNQSPEGRSFNRTVTITLEYLSAE